MSYLYTLEVCEVHGLPSSCSWLMLEVIVRTPRLLNTIRRKHTTEPFHAHAARGVNLTWEQARSSKAHVRLRLLSGAAAVETPMDAIAALSTAPAIYGCKGCKSAAAPLLLRGTKTKATAAIHLQLPAAAELDARCSDGGESGGGNGDYTLPHSAELHCIVRAVNRDTDCRASTVERESTAVASSVALAHAWVEAVPRTVQRASRAHDPRKRSWLLAWGLGRNAGARHSSGGAMGANDTPGGSALGASESAAAGVALRGVEGEPAMLGALPSPGSCSIIMDAASQPVGSGAFGSSFACAVAVDASAASALLRGGGRSPVGGRCKPILPTSGSASAGCTTLEARAESRALCAAGDMLPPLPNATSHNSGETCTASAPARMASMASPFGPLAHTPLAGRKSVEGTQRAAAALGTTAVRTPLSSTLVTAQSGCSEPQQRKRRRLGEFLSKLFIPSTFSMIRRVGGTDPATIDTPLAAAAISPSMDTDCACNNAVRLTPGPLSTSQNGTDQAAALTVAVATSSASAPGPNPARRHGNTLGVTPPSPRLGDVYRIQDNALISDSAVQLGFGLTAQNGAGIGAIPDRPPCVAMPASLHALDSPEYGEGLPAAGPDRLFVEPPVEGMAAASLASPMASSPCAPPAGCLYWLYGARARAAQQTSASAAVATDAGQQFGRKGMSGDGDCEAAAVGTSGVLPADCQKESQHRESQAREWAQRDPCCGAHGSWRGEGEAPVGVEAAGDCGSDSGSPLEAEIGRVVGFITGQSGLSEELRVVSLSQCQFLLDCLRNPDTCWLVADNLLQLKHEVGFPFDTGVPILGAPDWFRLVLQPLQHLAIPPQPPQQQAGVSTSEATACGLEGSEGTSAAGRAAASADGKGDNTICVDACVGPPLRQPEILKVRWARIDQRQAGGANACAAIALKVAAWCLLALQRWRVATASSTATTNVAVGGNPHPRRCDVSVWPETQPQQSQPQAHHANPVVSDHSTAGNSGTITRRESTVAQPPLLRSVSQRGRVSLSASLESMPADVLEGCIETGTEIWQAVLMQSPAARVASSTGDFDLEHMLQLGGYSQGLRMADYTAASLLRSSCGIAGMTSGDGATASGSGGGVDAGSLCRVSGNGRGYSCSRDLKGGTMTICRAVSLAGVKKEQGGDGDTSTTVSRGGSEVRRSREAMVRSSGCLFVQRSNSIISTSLQQQLHQKDEQQAGLMLPSQSQGAASADPFGARGGDGVEEGKAATAEPRSQCSQLQLLRTSQLGVSAFASVVRGLKQGVYVLGWHGHFATLWLRPGGVVHLIDSLGARLAADCPLAFILEFDTVQDFLAFFLARHRTRTAGVSEDDIAEGNMAALVEVHRMELQPQLQLQPQGQQGQGQHH